MSATEKSFGVDVDALAKGNPKVDPEQLREAQEAVAALRKEGLRPASYRIESPYRDTRQRATKR